MHILVSIAWLQARLAHPGTSARLVILDATLPPVGVQPPVDTQARYLAQHVPRAVFFDIDELSDHTTPLPHMLPSADLFARVMSTLGIAEDMTLVVYEEAGVFSAPRAWWMLRTFGATDVHILDGGLRAWVDAGLPTESGPVHPAPATFHVNFDAGAVKDFAALQQQLSTQGQVLDARSAARFAGTSPEPRPGISSGHMPGATSVPYTDLVENGRLKSPGDLRNLFLSRGVDLRAPVTTTCGSGVTAAIVALGLELAGATAVALYDGSWAEYATHPAAVIEKSA